MCIIKQLGLDFLIGLEVRADHPITCLNPEKSFKIFDAKIEDDKLYVRGQNTMWFHSGLVKLESKET